MQSFKSINSKGRLSSVLAKRIFFGSMAILAVILFGTLLMHGHILQREQAIESRQNIENLVENVTPPVARAIWQINEDTIQTYMNTLVTREEVAAVAYEDDKFSLKAGEGEVFANPEEFCNDIISEDFTGREIDGNILQGGKLDLCYIAPQTGFSPREFITISELPFLIAIFSTSIVLVIFTWNLVIAPLRQLSQHIADHKPVENFQRASFLGLDKEDDEIDQLINELTKLTLALNEERAIINASFPEIVDAIVQTDRNHNIQRYNRALEKLLNIEGKALDFDLSKIIPREALEDPSDRKSVFTVNDSILEISSSKMFNNNNTIGYLHIIRDLTTVKHLQTEVLQVSNLATIGRMSGEIAHDYNNILGSILNNAEFLTLSDGLDESEKQALNSIIESSHNGASITTQLLEFSQNQKYHLDYYSLREIINEFVEGIKPKLQKNIELKLGDLLDTHIYVDKGAFHNALRNLVMNAQESISNHGIIEISAEPSKIDGQEAAAIVIKDNGVGIDPKIADQIMKPFFTTKSKCKGRGAGLGLALVGNFVEGNHGEIDFESVLGEGTSVRLILPSHKKVQTQEPDKLAAASIRPEDITLLLIEDEKPLAKVLQNFLQGDGYKVITANSLADLRKANMANKKIDLVVSDIVLEEETVVEVYRYLVSSGYRPPIMLITGHLNEAMDGLIGELYPVNILAKPFRAGDLLNAIRVALVEIKSKETVKA